MHAQLVLKTTGVTITMIGHQGRKGEKQNEELELCGKVLLISFTITLGD